MDKKTVAVMVGGMGVVAGLSYLMKGSLSLAEVQGWISEIGGRDPRGLEAEAVSCDASADYYEKKVSETGSYRYASNPHEQREEDRMRAMDLRDRARRLRREADRLRMKSRG